MGGKVTRISFITFSLISLILVVSFSLQFNDSHPELAFTPAYGSQHIAGEYTPPDAYYGTPPIFVASPFANDFIVTGAEGGASGDDHYFPSNGDGTFGTRSDISGISTSDGPDVADMDNDGDNDFLYCDGVTGEVFLFDNIGGGQFTPSLVATGITTTASFCTNLRVDDFNEDGLNDFVVGDLNLANGVRVYLQGPIDTFTPQARLDAATSSIFGVATGDIDGDTHKDILFLQYTSSGNVWFLKGSGAGTFQPQLSLFNVQTDFGGSLSPGITVLDLDLDSDLDIIVGGAFSGTPTEIKGQHFAYLNDGTGSFTKPVGPIFDVDNQSGLDKFDFDGDGDEDLVVVTWSSKTVLYFQNNGDGTLASPITIGSLLGNSIGIGAPPSTGLISNNAPVANDDGPGVGFETTEDAILELLYANIVTSNDTDPDGDVLTITNVANPTTGSASIDDKGTADPTDDSIVYSPNGQFESLDVDSASGTDTMVYTVDDSQPGSTDTATITVTITGVNDAPDAVNDNPTISEDAGATPISFTANDSDPDDPLDLTAVNNAGITKGTLNVNLVANTISYNPAGAFETLDTGELDTSQSFTYTLTDDNGATDTATVSITIEGVNDAPIAIDDPAEGESAIETPEDNALNGIPVEANDIDVDVEPLRVSAVVDADDDTGESVTVTTIDGITELGTFSNDGLASPGSSVDYDPNGQFDYLAVTEFILDILDYTVTDETESDVGQLTVKVTGVNDPPQAFDDTAAINEDNDVTTSINLNLVNNDGDIDVSEQDGLFISSVVDGDDDTGESVQIFDFDGDAVGGVVFSADGSAAIDDNGTTEVSSDDDKVIYHPNGQFEHLAEAETTNDILTYTLEDPHGATDTATLTVTITGQNDAPVAVDDNPRSDAYDAPMNSNLVVNDPAIGVLGNDYDVDSDATFTATAVISVANGIDSTADVLLNSDGTFTVTPSANFEGETSFVYEITDNHGATDTATATISFIDSNFDTDSVREGGSEIYVEVTDAFADSDGLGGTDTVNVVITAQSNSQSGDGTGIFTIQESLIPGFFQSPIKFSETFATDPEGDDVGNPFNSPILHVVIPPTPPRIDPITLDYRDESNVDNNAVVTPANGDGASPTPTDPIIYDSEIYEIRNSAELGILDSSLASNAAINSINAYVRTASSPVGYLHQLIETGPSTGIFDSQNLIELVDTGITDPANHRLLAQPNDRLLATYLPGNFFWSFDGDMNGVADGAAINFGAPGNIPVVGNWDGTGGESNGLFVPSSGIWALDNNGDGFTDTAVIFGTTGDIPVVGNWDGVGGDGIGIFRPSTATWFLDNNIDGFTDIAVVFGTTGDTPVVGNWDGTGGTDIGVFRPSTSQWFLDNGINGSTDIAVVFGAPGFIPVVGNWDGVGGTDIGAFSTSTAQWFLDNGIDGVTDIVVTFGASGDTPVVGNWDGVDGDGIGIYSSFNLPGVWLFDDNFDGAFDSGFTFGATGNIPVVGNWDGIGGDSVGFISIGSGTAATQSRIIPIQVNPLTEGAAVDVTVAPPCDDDTDEDGVCDEWIVSDTSGISFSIAGTTYNYGCRPLLVDNDPNPSTKYSLTGNADPANSVCPKNDRKQLFIENDYMTGHKPPQASWEQVIDAFANAPVVNNDGSTGIDLFVTVDEDWGAHEIQIPFNGTDANPGFDQFKASFFGSSADRARADADAFLTGGRQHIRYMADIHSLQDSPLASGYSEINGNDATIHGGVLAGNTGSVAQIASTKMHEIGHMIGLDHGGADDLNCKPNYLSVMNYLFQFEDNLPGRPLDFSNSRLADLNENNLNENLGITLQLTSDDVTSLQSIIGGESGGAALSPITVTTGTPINYNRDSDSTDTTVQANISFFDIADCQDAPTLLSGHNDWANINLVFRDDATFADGVHTIIEAVNEITSDEVEAVTIAVIVFQIDSIIATLNDPDTGFTGTEEEKDAIIASLNAVKAKITSSPPDFDGALADLPAIRAAIVSLGITDPNIESEILDIIDFLISLLTSVVTADADHNAPTANKQVNIIDNLDPFEIILTGSDPDGDALAFSLVDPPLFGETTSIVQVSSSRAKTTYTPNTNPTDAIPDFVNTDSFTFKVNDGTTDSTPASVLIVLNQIPTAKNTNVILGEDDPNVLIPLTGSDADSNDEFTYSIKNDPTKGTLGPITCEVDTDLDGACEGNRSATVVYTPSAEFAGFDSFKFIVNDGTQNSAPATAKITVAGETVQIVNQNPPKEDPNLGAQTKPEIEVDKDSSIHIILTGTSEFDVTTVDRFTVFFGLVGEEVDGAQGIHIFDEPFDANVDEPHISDHQLKGGEPITPGFLDFEFHFRMSDINVDPANNDASGKQLLCLTGIFSPPGSDVPQRFYGCERFTIGEKHTGEEQQSSSEPVTQSPEVTQAIEDIGAIIQTIEGPGGLLENGELKPIDAKQLTDELSKAVMELTEGTVPNAIGHLNNFKSQVDNISNHPKTTLTQASANGLKTAADNVIALFP